MIIIQSLSSIVNKQITVFRFYILLFLRKLIPSHHKNKEHSFYYIENSKLLQYLFMKIVSVVITFYPNKNELITNIMSYIDYVDHLIIWDNTPDEEYTLNLSDFGGFENKISIEGVSENKGIGYALNRVAEDAINRGYNWMLTMDQDSAFADGKFFDQFQKETKSEMGIISPVHNAIRFNQESNIPNEIDIIATSGNLVNLKAWQSVGGFNENLFIDEVDHDFCLRIKQKGFKVFECKNILLNHKLGDIKEIKTLRGKAIRISLHSALRTYYIVRNSFYMFNQYQNQFPDVIKARKRNLKIELRQIILYSDNKFQKLWFAFKGYCDYKRNKFGPFNQPSIPLVK